MVLSVEKKGSIARFKGGENPPFLFLLYRKLNKCFFDTTVGGLLQSIPQGVTVSKFDEKENLRTPEVQSPYGQDSAQAKRVPILR
jgi:hypothetical protein